MKRLFSSAFFLFLFAEAGCSDNGNVLGTAGGPGSSGMGGSSENQGGTPAVGKGGGSASGGQNAGKGGASSGGNGGNALGGSAEGGSAAGEAGNWGNAGQSAVGSCDELQTQYAAALQAAKECDPAADENLCTESVAGALGGCSCPAWVVPLRPSLGELQELADQWDAQGCTVPCPQQPTCLAVEGTCQVWNSSAGQCTP
jgi:hypothetical protein